MQDSKITETGDFEVRQRSLDGGRPDGQVTLNGELLREEVGGDE